MTGREGGERSGGIKGTFAEFRYVRVAGPDRRVLIRFGGRSIRRNVFFSRDTAVYRDLTWKIGFRICRCDRPAPTQDNFDQSDLRFILM